MVKITIKDLSFSYGSRRILDELNFVVGDSEVLSLVGPNGSGKTTLIKCIDRILKPKGAILLNGGRNLESLSRQEVAKLIGYVPQSTTGVLPPPSSIRSSWEESPTWGGGYLTRISIKSSR